MSVARRAGRHLTDRKTHLQVEGRVGPLIDYVTQPVASSGFAR